MITLEEKFAKVKDWDERMQKVLADLDVIFAEMLEAQVPGAHLRLEARTYVDMYRLGMVAATEDAKRKHNHENN